MSWGDVVGQPQQQRPTTGLVGATELAQRSRELDLDGRSRDDVDQHVPGDEARLGDIAGDDGMDAAEQVELAPVAARGPS